MKKLTLLIAILTLTVGFSPVKAAGAKVFLASIDKSMKISGQMASGKVPYNPARAYKEMKNIQNAVAAFEKDEKAGASKKVVSCADKLKSASAKAASAAKAGQGAFKAVYQDLVNGYKDCQSK